MKKRDKTANIYQYTTLNTNSAVVCREFDPKSQKLNIFDNYRNVGFQNLLLCTHTMNAPSKNLHRNARLSVAFLRDLSVKY